MPLQFDTSKPRVQYDIAYACFLVLGLGFVVFIVGILQSNLEPYNTAVLAISFMPIALLTLVIGVGFSIRLWRHAPLPILSALAFITVAFLTVEHCDKPVATALLSYGIIAIVTSLGWFLIFRWRAHGARGRDKSRPLYRGAPRVQYDIAYGCFLLYGLTILLGEILTYNPIVHLMVLRPLTYLSWVALVVGVGLAIRLWRHTPLPILAALTVLFLLVSFFLSIDEVVSRMCADAEFYGECATKQRAFWANFITAVYWAYGITATVITLWWFSILRRRADGAMGSNA